MLRAIIISLLLLLPLLCISQENYNFKSSVVSKADLEGTRYLRDTTANAFYIYEKGYSRIESEGNYGLLTDYSGKIKILNKEGFDQSTFEILLYRNKNRKEVFRNLIAFTHNLENGKIVKTQLEEDKIYREKYDENYTLVKFTFPNIRPGSVITYSYQTESPFRFNFRGWDFQDDIPKIYSEYIADLPGNYVYNIRLVGAQKLDTEENSIKKDCFDIGYGRIADCAHSKYVMKNIPAFKKEKFMTAKKNYFSRIEYELKEFKNFDGTKTKYTSTWKSVDKELKTKRTIGQQLKKLNATKNVLPDSIKNMPYGLDKAKSIYKYITTQYNWNDEYKIFTDVDIKEVMDTKVGNVGEINVLLHNVYKQQGFSAAPVLLSTRNNGYATKLHPILSDFNYLIVQLEIDKQNYLLDATEKTLPFDQIPFRCLNQYGRLLDFKNGSSWIDVKPKKRSSYYYREKLTLTEDLSLKGIGKYTYVGYHANAKRKTLDRISEEKYIQNILNTEENLSVVKATVQNLKELEKPFIEEVHFIKSTENIEDIIYVKPFTKIFFKENPFKLSERTYPVDFGYKDSFTYITYIEIPDNYEFQDIPKNLNYALPGKSGKLSLDFNLQGNQLLINHTITFLSSYYPVDYYSALKEFFNLIVDMENNTLIAIKKTS
ncbi:DUF3857 domain-containing protein [Aquimarina litoralis]|uniref:DUF3857 domain-containing protein n=1 Tax=Aquimarina litoralis TaxID=584605 RepID=UPI001C597393|nr:DUF3857 domain-containing protein [Aquimarina litoralis]MBW1297521.1 DUF3857 domain-containing protein [Aquimarina litoralis]